MLVKSVTNTNVPWGQVTSHITKKYNILGTYDLAIYDYRMDILLDELSKFKDYSFDFNQRIIFYHYDTEFYLGDCGFTTYNFINILHYLNIPHWATILLTAHYGLEHHFEKYAASLGYITNKNSIISNSFIKTLSNPFPSKFETSDISAIKYPFLCLNGSSRSHRIMFLCTLQELGILSLGLTSWNFDLTKKPFTNFSFNYENNKCPINLLTLSPPTRVNDRVTWSAPQLEIYNKHSHKFINQKYVPLAISEYNPECTIEEHFKKSFLYVITETVFDNPTQFITEKTFKALINRRPFVILGPCGTLKILHHFGFKTFDSIFDESYDTIINPSDRLVAVANIVNQFTNKSIDELKEICYAIEDILDYNYNHYVNYFCDVGLKETLENL